MSLDGGKNMSFSQIFLVGKSFSYLEGVFLFRVESLTGLDDQSESLGPTGIALSTTPLLQASPPLLHSRRVHSETGGWLEKLAMEIN